MCRCVHRPRAARDGSQTPPATSNSVVVRPPRLPSPPSPRGRRGPGRGAQRPFANQKNRRAQNDLGRRPSTPYSAAQTTGATARRRDGLRCSTTSLGDLLGRPGGRAARRGAPAVDQEQRRGGALTASLSRPRPFSPSRYVARKRLATCAPAYEAPPRFARSPSPSTDYDRVGGASNTLPRAATSYIVCAAHLRATAAARLALGRGARCAASPRRRTSRSPRRSPRSSIMAAQLAQAISQATNKVYSAKVDGELTVTWSVTDPRALDHGAEIFWQVRHSIPAPRAYEPI